MRTSVDAAVDWTRREVGSLATASFVLSFVALAGLHGVGPIHLSAVTALLWGLIGAGAAALALRRARDDRHWLVGILAFTLSLASVAASVLVLLVTAPCGSSCL